jgi:cation transport regulator ChaC
LAARGPRPADWVFGYASLVERPGARLAALPGFRRRWDVAMDNSVDLPGYKYYVDPDTGERPRVFVTFLNLVEASGSGVNGVVFPVSPDELAALDARERNYRRREVTLPGVEGRAWAYTGSDEARARYQDAVALGAAVVDRSYLDLVRERFGSLGADALILFDQSTDPPSVPVRSLRRVELG